MTKLMILLRASGTFLATLFAPYRPVVALSPNGHAQLKGWDCVPEEIMVEHSKGSSVSFGTMALLSLEGDEPGRVYTLPQGRSKLATHGVCNFTLPMKKNPGLVEVNAEHGKVSMSGKFALNGRETQSEVVFDYDELDLFGYRYLCLDLKGGQNV